MLNNTKDVGPLAESERDHAWAGGWHVQRKCAAARENNLVTKLLGMSLNRCVASITLHPSKNMVASYVSRVCARR